MEEIQKAKLGRKWVSFPLPQDLFIDGWARYAKVDRRPLDPPPIVLLKYFTVDDVGTPNELEQEIDDYR